MKLSGYFAGIAFVLALSLVANPVEAAISNGMLVRAFENSRIYYIDQGVKRWVSSLDTLHDQGLNQTIVNVPLAELDAIPEGEKLSSESNIILPGEESSLPDLVPLPMYDLQFDTVNGRRVLRFTSTFWNQGDGVFELIADTGSEHADGLHDSFQRIIRLDGGTRDKIVGNFLWHAPHAHFHFDDFADYVFELIRPASPTTASIPPIVTQKTTFCMRDNEAIDLTIEHAGARTFNGCGVGRQGVSVGWADVYGASLPDQYIDVQDLPPGIYQLSFVVDPTDRFLESKKDNNSSVVFIDLNVPAGTFTVLASGSPFDSSRNSFTNGTLVRGTEDPGVYVMQKNKKLLITSEAMFLSRGYSWDDILWMPQTVVDAIPNPIIRSAITGQIFQLNDHGFKRRLLNPEIVDSYGLTNADIVDVTEEELNSYIETDFIMKAGTDSVFSLNEKTFVSRLAGIGSLGHNPDSVHEVNQMDFDAYTTRVVATGLDVPWDIVTLPDGDLLVTERPGTIRRIGSHAATISLPGVNEYGEGGLMGLALHPDFATNQQIYVYYTATSGNRVVRFRLEGDSLKDEKTIITGIPSSIYHDGGQIEFGPDGMLYITTGDATVEANAPNLGSIAGKTLRLTPEGVIPSDNPFGTAVWSYGHRNAQGIAWDDRGRLWETEHGRSGASSGYDELNLIEKGKNYGWPASQGDSVASGTVGPKVHSGATTTWAPSGMAFLDGSLFFAGLRGESLYEAVLDTNGNTSGVKAHFAGTYGRLRAVVNGPDNSLYITTSNRDGRGSVQYGDDKIIQVFPGMLWDAAHPSNAPGRIGFFPL